MPVRLEGKRRELQARAGGSRRLTRTSCSIGSLKRPCAPAPAAFAGESDGDFAARLASAIRISGGADQEAALDAASARPSRPSTAAGAPNTPSGQRAQHRGGAAAPTRGGSATTGATGAVRAGPTSGTCTAGSGTGSSGGGSSHGRQAASNAAAAARASLAPRRDARRHGAWHSCSSLRPCAKHGQPALNQQPAERQPAADTSFSCLSMLAEAAVALSPLARGGIEWRCTAALESTLHGKPTSAQLWLGLAAWLQRRPPPLPHQVAPGTMHASSASPVRKRSGSWWVSREQQAGSSSWDGDGIYQSRAPLSRLTELAATVPIACNA